MHTWARCIFVDIELGDIEGVDQADDQGQKNIDFPKETISNTDNEIMISSMECENEIFSAEDTSPLVEVINSQSKYESKCAFNFIC